MMRKLVDKIKKTYRCRHCKVEVISKKDVRAVFGKSHGKHCPRRFK